MRRFLAALGSVVLVVLGTAAAVFGLLAESFREQEVPPRKRNVPARAIAVWFVFLMARTRVREDVLAGEGSG